MPVGPFETEVLRTLAANRNPESFIGGATVLNHEPIIMMLWHMTA